MFENLTATLPAVAEFNCVTEKDIKNMGGCKKLCTKFVMAKTGKTSPVSLCLVEKAEDKVYAHLTVRLASGGYLSAVDSCSGYGYHLESSATGGAIQKAGIKLSEPIYGMGDVAIDKALIAIAKAANPRISEWKIVER